MIEKDQNGRWHLIMAIGNNEENQLGDEQLDKKQIGEEQEMLVMPIIPTMPKSSSR